MPTALRIGPYRFYFYSYDCSERRHMHVDRENWSAKFWLDPDVALEENHGYSRKELRDLERILRENFGEGLLKNAKIVNLDHDCPTSTNLTRKGDCSKRPVQQGRRAVGARSVHGVREHDNRPRTPLADFFNSSKH